LLLLEIKIKALSTIYGSVESHALTHLTKFLQVSDKNTKQRTVQSEAGS